MSRCVFLDNFDMSLLILIFDIVVVYVADLRIFSFASQLLNFLVKSLYFFGEFLRLLRCYLFLTHRYRT